MVGSEGKLSDLGGRRKDERQQNGGGDRGGEGVRVMNTDGGDETASARALWITVSHFCASVKETDTIQCKQIFL